jgi:hypothetical protein
MASIIARFTKRFFWFSIVVLLFTSCTEFLTALSENSITYSRVAITSIKLVRYSQKKPDGLSWDPLGGKPDIYLRIREGSGPFITKETYNNVQDGVQLTWLFSQPFQMSSLSNTLTIAFYDEESGLNVGNDDFMGSVVFSPARYKSGTSNPYPSQITLFSTSTPSVSATVSLKWIQ